MNSRMVWGLLGAVVVLAALLQPGCRPTGVANPAAPEEDEAAAEAEAAESPDGRGPTAGPDEAELLVGQMCPEAARGRPAVRPLFALAGAWRTDDALLGRLIASGAARQLAVLGWDGRRAGVLSGSGAASERGETLLVGSYAGSSPCAREVPLGQDPEEDPACRRALGGCGVAIGSVEKPAGMGARPFGEDAELADLATSGACIDGDALVVDVDGSGAASFSLAAMSADAVPAELVAAPGRPASCDPAFALEGGRGGVRVDVLAVADLDGSGRAEILLAIGEGEGRVWALYSASRTPARLDRVAVARVPNPG